MPTSFTAKLVSVCIVLTTLLSSSFSLAQITLTAATHTPSIGESHDYMAFTGVGIDPRNDGAGQIWDFSGVTGATPSTINYADPSDGVDQANHPGADFVGLAGVGFEEYFIADADGLSFKGRYLPGSVREVYTDKREILRFPITYGDTYNDTFDGTSETLAVSFMTDRGGTAEISGDAYGDLILPYGTLSNVLRVRVVDNYTDEVGGTTFFTYTDTVYFWFHASTASFVASYSLFYIDGLFGGSGASYIQEGAAPTSIDYTAVPKISLYPNPAVDFAIIEGLETATEVTISNTGGAVVLRENLAPNARNQIDISMLPAGVYLVSLASPKGILTESLVKR